MKTIERKDVEAALGVGDGRRPPWRRVGPLFLSALALAAMGYAAWRAMRPPEARLVAAYVTRPAERASITVRVTATGAVQPTNRVDISSELSGVVREVHVDFNSPVKAGAPLATLDQVKLVAAVDNARARLLAAQAALKDAEANLGERSVNWERKRRLAESSNASLTDRDAAKAAFERALATVETAKSNILAAQAQLKLDETNLTRAQIVSPIDGVVLMRKVDPGQTVASSLQAPILFTIAEDLRRMEVQVDVDEADVGAVREGQPATFTVDAFPGRRFEARVRMVRFGSEVVQGVVTYKAVLSTTNDDLLLRPGMTATAEIVVAEVRDALTIPNQALRFTPQTREPAPASRGFLDSLLPGRPPFRAAAVPRGAVSAPSGPRTVYVLRDGEPVAVSIVAGAADERRTQVLKGALNAGDPVIVDAGRAR